MSLSDITDKDCLLVIDVQNDFCSGGALEVPDGDAIVPIINGLIPKFSCVVLSQDWHPRGHSSFASQHPGKEPMESVSFPYGEQTLWPDHCVQGTSGAEFHSHLNAHQAHMIVRKGFRQPIDSYSSFFENDKTTSTGLSGYLKNRAIERVFCVGLATDFCVRFSAEDAIKEGFSTTVLGAACRGIDFNDSVKSAFDAMGAAGIVVDHEST